MPEPIAASPTPATPFGLGDWLVDPALDELRRPGQAVKLEPRAMRLLCHLATRPGEVMSAEELLDAVWPGLVVSQNSVYQAIAQLRRVLDDDSDSPRYIATVPRKGYRLIATPGPAGGTARPAAPAARSPQGKRWGAGLAVCLLALAAGWRFWPGASSLTARPAIAVMPFSDLSTAKSDQAFCDGLAEEIINTLARSADIKVTARTSAFSFRDRPTDARAIGSALGVTHILEGSVRREGARIRIAAQLVNVSNGFQEWSESFDRPFADVIDVQQDISRAVARALAVKLVSSSAAGAQHAPTASAYELYLLGRFQQLQRQPETIARAIEYHRAAIARDPGFALPYAGLALAYMNGMYYANVTLEDAAAQVRENVAKALAIDAELPEAYLARGLMHLELFELDAAEQDLERAIALKANYADAYVNLGMVHEYRGDPRRALLALDQAAQLDPLHVVLQGRRCQALTNLARYAEATAACQRMIELAPGIANGYWGTGLVALAQGKTDAAIAGYRAALAHTPERHDLASQLAWLYLDLGLPADANAAFPAVTHEDRDFLALELERARAWIATGDLAGLRRHLDSLPLDANVNGADLLDAALLELAAGRATRAQALAQRAVSDDSFSVTRRIENAWQTRWGRSDGMTLAVIAAAAGDALTADKYLVANLQWLDRVERNGQVWHGAQYLRASVYAQQGRPDQAMQALRAARERGWRSAWWMRADPALAALRSRPDFNSLLAQIDADNAAARQRLAHAPQTVWIQDPRMMRSAQVPTR